MNKNKILSYKDWLKNTKDSGSLTNPYQVYLGYVNTWYDNTFKGKSTKELTAEEYREFLLTLKLVTSDKGLNTFISNLDYTNPNEVGTAIPYFAKNLKDVARYISKKRDDGKYASEDYSYLDSNFGLEREIYKMVLELFIGSSDLPFNDIAELIGGTSVSVEELYDDNEYHDKSPNKGADEYYDIEKNAEFYSECGDEFMQWAIESGFNPLYSNSDIFNPSASGTLPLSGYIDYNIESEQLTQFQGNLPNTTMGEQHLYLSGDEGERAITMGVYSDADRPWDNLSNRYFSTIATLPLIDSIYSKYNVGGFSIPSKLGMSVALGKNKYYKPSELTIQGDKNNFPDPSVYSNGYSFTKEYQDSSIVYNTYLNWIDIKQVSGRGKGILSSNGTYQEMIPYQTTLETTSIPYLGINQLGDKTDPWYGSEDKKWEDDVSFPSDFRKIYDIDEWYSTNISLTGVEDQWGIDIFGNNYALYKDISGTSMYEHMSNATGKLFVRGVDGGVGTYEEFFSDSLSGGVAGFELDSLIRMDVFNDIVVMEDINGAIVAQLITFEDGEYKASRDNVASTLDFETTAFSPFDYCFDDRTETLYVVRYETVPVDGFFEFVIYKFVESRFVSVYSSRSDTTGEINALRNNFTFTDITAFPSVTISSLSDTMILTYIGGLTSVYVVSIPFIMTGGFIVDEITVVRPNAVYGSSSDPHESESRKLIKTMVSDDKLTLLLEGEETFSKYLQVIPI